MLDHPVELLPAASDTLEALAAHHRLILITKGDLRDQERKLSKSGIARYFEAVEIVSEKDAQTYSRIFARHGIEPKSFIMVGNSVKSDILPVLQLGGSGIHVPYRITWGHEHAETPPSEDGRFYRAASLADLPEIISRWIRPL
jgi:putative hydrolase of the HAD superfamily